MRSWMSVIMVKVVFCRCCDARTDKKNISVTTIDKLDKFGWKFNEVIIIQRVLSIFMATTKVTHMKSNLNVTVLTSQNGTNMLKRQLSPLTEKMIHWIRIELEYGSAAVKIDLVILNCKPPTTSILYSYFYCANEQWILTAHWTRETSPFWGFGHSSFRHWARPECCMCTSFDLMFGCNSSLVAVHVALLENINITIVMWRCRWSWWWYRWCLRYWGR